MRKNIIFATFCGMIIAFFIAVPFFWQQHYSESLLHALPIGSTQADYAKAAVDGHLGQSMPRFGLTFWRPFEFHGFVYTLLAYPQWDASGHLSGFSLSPKISFRGYGFFFVPEPERNIDDTL